MPLRRYLPETPGRCPHCRDGFDHREPAANDPLTECPKCGRTVFQDAAPTITIQEVSEGRNVNAAKRAGFAVLKKIGDGEFERL